MRWSSTTRTLSVLILSGSPIIGSFDFRARVDFVRVPGVIKLRNGDYTSLNLLIDIEETLAMRASIIQHTAEIFDPDIFIVDKEPLGLRGEVQDTLKMLKERGTPLVLGLRDVMDEPAPAGAGMGAQERRCRRCAISTTRSGSTACRRSAIPLAGIELPKSVRRKMTYTGYLRRTLPQTGMPPHRPLQKIEPALHPGHDRRRRRRRGRDRLGAARLRARRGSCPIRRCSCSARSCSPTGRRSSCRAPPSSPNVEAHHLRRADRSI